MARKRYTPEQIIGMLREAEVRLSQGERIGEISRSLGISEQSYYRWRRAWLTFSPPSNSGCFSDWDAVYWLRRESGFLSLDSEWLVIRFDETSHVLEYQLMRD
ncbi:transposase [Aurantiacibacter marinus]|uniref:transposase n=1 Tax=Aurantiacibacter marinus TaxID=874156 RepID=UPI0009E51203